MASCRYVLPPSPVLSSNPYPPIHIILLYILPSSSPLNPLTILLSLAVVLHISGPTLFSSLSFPFRPITILLSTLSYFIFYLLPHPQSSHYPPIQYCSTSCQWPYPIFLPHLSLTSHHYPPIHIVLLRISGPSLFYLLVASPSSHLKDQKYSPACLGGFQ